MLTTCGGFMCPLLQPATRDVMEFELLCARPHGPSPRDRAGAGRVRYAGPCCPRSQRSPPMTSTSCSRGIWPMAPSKEAIGKLDVDGCGVDGASVEGSAAADGVLARLVGSSTPRIARQAVAPVARASAAASGASASRIVVSNSSSRAAPFGGLGLSCVSVMAVPSDEKRRTRSAADRRDLKCPCCPWRESHQVSNLRSGLLVRGAEVLTVVA